MHSLVYSLTSKLLALEKVAASCLVEGAPQGRFHSRLMGPVGSPDGRTSSSVDVPVVVCCVYFVTKITKTQLAFRIETTGLGCTVLPDIGKLRILVEHTVPANAHEDNFSMNIGSARVASYASIVLENLDVHRFHRGLSVPM